MTHNKYTANGIPNQQQSASSPSRLLTPNIVDPNDIEHHYFVETYEGSDFVNTAIEKVGKDDGALVESAVKRSTNGRTNGHITEFSFKARHKWQSEASKISKQLAFKDGAGVLFPTFTYREFPKDPQQIKRSWKNLRDSLLYNYPGSFGLWRWGWTDKLQRIAPHIHMILYGIKQMADGSNEFSDFKKWITNRWCECIYLTPEVREANDHGNGVHVENVHSIEAVEKYISAYISKDKDVQPDWWGGSHHWGYYNRIGVKEAQEKLKIPVDKDTFEQAQDLFLEQKHEDTFKSVRLLNRIFISNLSKFVVKDDIERVFSEFGNVEGIHIYKDKGDVSKQKAYLTMPNRIEAKQAVDVLSGKPLVQGLNMEIQYTPIYAIENIFEWEDVSIEGKDGYTDGTYVELKDCVELIPPSFVDSESNYKTLVIRRAIDPFTLEVEGYIVARFKSDAEHALDTPGYEAPVKKRILGFDLFRFKSDSSGWEVVCENIQMKELRFLQTTKHDKSLSCIHFREHEKLMDLLGGEEAVMADVIGQKLEEFMVHDVEQMELAQQAIYLGMTYEDLANEVDFIYKSPPKPQDQKMTYLDLQSKSDLTNMSNLRKNDVFEQPKLN